MLPMPDCEPTINTIIHEKISTTIVLIAVATVESVFFIPHFARIAVSPAKIAEPNANTTHIFVTFSISFIRKNHAYLRTLVFLAFKPNLRVMTSSAVFYDSKPQSRSSRGF